MTHTRFPARATLSCLGALMITMLATVGAAQAQSVAGTGSAGRMQLIPSIGVSKSTDSNAGNAKAYGGLALRFPIAPLLKLEGGIAYRQDSYFGGDLKVKQWPTTASLWLTPAPSIYLGGGVGWYHTTLDFPNNSPSSSSTSNKAGVHIGGGFDVPMAPNLSLDLNGRYVFMTKSDATFDVPSTFNPDFWNMTIGLAIGF